AVTVADRRLLRRAGRGHRRAARAARHMERRVVLHPHAPAPRRDDRRRAAAIARAARAGHAAGVATEAEQPACPHALLARRSAPRHHAAYPPAHRLRALQLEPGALALAADVRGRARERAGPRDRARRFLWDGAALLVGDHRPRAAPPP